jgi:hypothetical protein
MTGSCSFREKQVVRCAQNDIYSGYLAFDELTVKAHLKPYLSPKIR